LFQIIPLLLNNAVLDFSSIEIPVGIRHYFFLNENLKLFANAQYSFDINGNSKIDFEQVGDLKVFRQGFLVFGGGLVFKEKISFELRNGTNRDNFWNNQRFIELLFLKINEDRRKIVKKQA